MPFPLRVLVEIATQVGGQRQVVASTMHFRPGVPEQQTLAQLQESIRSESFGAVEEFCLPPWSGPARPLDAARENSAITAVEIHCCIFMATAYVGTNNDVILGKFWNVISGLPGVANAQLRQGGVSGWLAGAKWKRANLTSVAPLNR